MVVAGQRFAPWQMGRAQQPVLAGLLALLQFLLAQGIEKLTGAPALASQAEGEAMLCQWELIHANRSCRSRIGRAASAACGRGMEGKEVVIALQAVLGNALRWVGAMGRQPEALLQHRQRQPLPLVGLLEPGQHRLVAGQPAAHVQRLDHQPSGGDAITAIA